MISRVLAPGVVATALVATTVVFAASTVASAAPPPPTAPGADPEAKKPAGPRPGARSGSGGGTSPSTPPPPGRATPPPPSGGAPGDTAAPAEPEGPPVDLSDTWGYSRSRPTQPRYVRSADGSTNSTTAPNPVGFYSGVSTGGNHVPPRPPDNFDTRPATMTWTGFERAPEGSRVFFEVNGPVRHSVSQDGLVLKVRLVNTKVNVRNNQRHLDLRYFETPVRMVNIRRRGKDTEATIQLKRESSPTVNLQDGKGGYKLLTIQFDDARANGPGAGSDPYRTAGGGGYTGYDPNAPGAGGAGSDSPPPPPPPGGAGTATGIEAAGDGTLPAPPAAVGEGPPYGQAELDLFIVNWD
jgi:hypothetical protein